MQNMAAFLLPRADSTPTCYASRGDDDNGNTKIDADGVQTPCGGSTSNVTSCCIQGHECMEDGICHFRDNTDKSSGYYIGGCTDKTFNDKACSKACIRFNQHDVIYNRTSGLWSCCYNKDQKEIDCTNPTSQTFQAIPLDMLVVAPSFSPIPSGSSLTLSSTGTSSSSSAATSTSSTAPPPASASATDTPSSSGGLSSGAKAGIGVGCAIVGLVILAALVFFILKRRKASRQRKQVVGYAGEKAQQDHYATAPMIPGELGSGERPPELGGNPRSELEASARFSQ